MNAATIRHNIQIALAQFQDQALGHSARQLLAAIGYRSDLGLDHEWTTVETFLQTFDTNQVIDPHRALVEEWQEIDFLFQLTEDEINTADGINVNFDRQSLEPEIYQSYLFFALKLNGSNYNRTELSNIVREINRLTPIPSMVIFAYGSSVTIAVIDRRPHRRDESRDVLEKITLIKDIDTFNPHRAHIEILVDLSLSQLIVNFPVENFLQLHRAWQSVLNISELNKRFYRELSDWYFWAVKEVTFPSAAGEDPEVRNATSVIRLITRLMFVWFLKEKGLIPVTLFRDTVLDHLLHNLGPEESTYYKAILQNLFFATLNQEMGSRSFWQVSKQQDNITNLYHYADYFVDIDQALQLFASIPFLNGGLFECLDKTNPDLPGQITFIDGFSDQADNPVEVPNFLFFSQQREVDLNQDYGTNNKLYRVRGLIHIFDRYKFTVSENTPLEEEVALDPELLGQIFENLLAAYNPETKTTARKQTGSFYTPRQIVNYMVDESLISYLLAELKVDSDIETKENKLKHLMSLADGPHQFNTTEVDQLIQAIDELKILDPSCGSGAFPMGILQKLVLILCKLDPNNQRWKKRQLNVAHQISDPQARGYVIQSIQRVFDNNESNYGRKLYLIQNCIYGVDIQPIAVQIAKLRCFIALVVEQKIDDNIDNRGVLPLPNLETKFVAANTLVSLDRPAQMTIRLAEIDVWEEELESVRQFYFTARTIEEKAKYRDLDAQIRTEIITLLRQDRFLSETTEMIVGWNPYDQNTSANFFDPEWMFNCQRGFDIVIANPPYLESRHPSFSSALKNLLQAEIKNYLGSEAPNIPRGADLLIYFFERSLRLISTNGYVVFIAQNAWLSTEYGKKFQSYLLKHTHVRAIIDSDYKYFSDDSGPNINTVISIFCGNKRPENANLKFITCHNDIGNLSVGFLQNATTQVFPYSSKHLRNYKWSVLLSSDRSLMKLLDRMELNGVCLNEVPSSNLSLGQGLNLTKDYFIDNDRVDSFALTDRPEVIPIVTSADGAPFSVQRTKRYLILETLSSQIENPDFRFFDQNSTTKLPAVLLMPRGIGRHYCALNEISAFSASIVEIYNKYETPLSRFQLLNLWLFLNSSISWLIREIMGRKNLGGGMLKAEAIDLKTIPLYYNFCESDSTQIECIFNQLKNRQALRALEEVEMPEHRAIDEIVFDHLEIPQVERELIINFLKDIIATRENKSAR